MIEQLKVIDSAQPFQRSVKDFVRVLEENPLLDGRLIEDISLTAGDNYIDHKLDRVPVGFLVVGSDDGRVIGSDRQIVNLTTPRTNAADTFAATLGYPFVIMPHAATLVSVQAGAATVGAGNAQYDLYYWRGAADQGTALVAPMVLAVAFTEYPGTIAPNLALLEDDLLHYRVTGAGSGTTGGSITLEFESGVFCSAWDDKRLTLTSGNAVDVNLWVF